MPGEEIGTTEEFLAGEGTYESKGKIYSSYLGTVNLDIKERIASVSPINPLVTLKAGDIVLARVTDVKNSMVIADVVRVEGRKRKVTGETMGSIHISKISEGFTQDVWKEYRIGDIIRAMVEQVKPSLQLFTGRQDLGVLLALCTRCRMPLEKKGKNLFCKNCRRSEMRKMIPKYGSYVLGDEGPQ
ncbi:MAG: exosome complex RNA-binding protein Csl4 [Thermoplasmata archaeon]|nr:MAG: exosome complex RNA-binding protein Csl4 [Thermoplasmata archaeon]